MTFLESKRSVSRISIALIALLCGVGIASGALVVAYNRSVGAEHAVQRIMKEIELVNTENAEAQRRIYALFTSEKVETVAAERDLMKDPRPTYVSLTVLR